MRGVVTRSWKAIFALAAIMATLCVAAPRGRGQDVNKIIRDFRIPPPIAQVKPPAERAPDFKPSVNARQFAEAAAACLTKIDSRRHPFIRFVALQDGFPMENGHNIVSYIGNALSKSPNIQRPTIIHDRIAILETDLLFPDIKDRIRFLEAYEKLADNESFFSPTFATPRVSDLKQGAKIQISTQSKTKIDAIFQSIDGDIVIFIREKDGTPEKCHSKFVFPVQGELIASAHLGDFGVQLTASTGSRVPIMELTEWVNGTFNSIRSVGGLYYDLADIKKSTDPNKSDLEVWLNKNGATVESIESPTAKTKMLTVRSEVTEKVRVTAMFYSLSTRPELGPSIIFLTFDVSKKNFISSKDAFNDLLKYDGIRKRNYDGIEAMAIKQNGHIEYAIFNGKLELLEEVPGDVARDKEAPPHAGEDIIFSGVSCMRCHDKTPGNDGFRSIVNNALALKNGADDGGLIADTSINIVDNEDIEQLISEFGADPDNVLITPRVMFNKTVFRSTGKKPGEMSKAVALAYEQYTDGMVTPEAALLDLGFSVKDGDGAAFLRELLPVVKDGDGAVVAGETIRGFRENSAVQWLKLGVPVHGFQWRLYRKQAMLRAEFQEAEWKKNKAAVKNDDKK